MNEYRVASPDFVPKLPDRLEKRKRLDVADRAADFDDRNLGLLRDTVYRRLDLVGDMGNHLDRVAKVVAASLLLDDGFVDSSGREVVPASEFSVGVAFVMTQIQIGLRTVIGHVDFTMLVGTHRPGIDVEVRVELENADPKTPALQ